ncbi:hypothetical protein MTO96_048689 [Rhipicephalus appendiculatus]
MCDLVFYDSFFTDDKNNLTNGYHNLSPGTQSFLSWAFSMNKSEFGASFAPSTAASQSHYRSLEFYDEIYELWNQSIFHFGFLNVHREFSERDALAETLVTLREIDAHIQESINVHSRPSYMVLGASIQNRSMYGAIHLMSTIFMPSLFIAIGHISYSDAAFPDCRILPPTVWTFPKGVNRSTDFPYGHTYFESAVLLEEVRDMDTSVPLSLSLSLAGRYYEPRFTDPGSPKNHDFGLFKPCQDFNTSHYGDPVSEVCMSSQVDWKYESNLRNQYAYAFSKSESRTITYDTMETLQNKVCDTKYHYVKMDYNLAVYDTDYDASSIGCPKFGLLSGAFNRLEHARKLQQYLQTQYYSPENIFTCRALS